MGLMILIVVSVILILVAVGLFFGDVLVATGLFFIDVNDPSAAGISGCLALIITMAVLGIWIVVEIFGTLVSFFK